MPKFPGLTLASAIEKTIEEVIERDDYLWRYEVTLSTTDITDHGAKVRLEIVLYTDYDVAPPGEAEEQEKGD